jgi:hypothetical protein
MIVIDQGKIDAPDFPRGQDWWRRFTPPWVSVTVRDDGTVAMTHSGLVMRYAAKRGVWWEPDPDQSNAARRKRERTVANWIGHQSRLAVAIVAEAAVS